MTNQDRIRENPAGKPPEEKILPKSAEAKNDFSQGSVVRGILSLALPMTLAQFINILYNIVDRMYIGRLPEHANDSLSGLGLCLPIITIVLAFANLFGVGGAPLCSIERGKGNLEKASRIMGNSFCLLVVFGFLLMAAGLIFKRPLLYLFGASDDTFPFADSYLTIYLTGSVFVMVSLGMNNFINSQGFGRVGMCTVLIGAALNLALDPVFIFLLGMGVRGAAIATVISQAASALWTVSFLSGPRAILRLRVADMRLVPKLVGKITALGTSGFVMAVTNSAVQIVCNASLSAYGGDLYVGVMTILNSIREVVVMPVTGITNGAQPVIGYNYGANRPDRVRKAVAFMSVSCIVYTTAVWGILHLFPAPFIRIIASDEQLVAAAVPAMRIYFFGFFLMSLQFSGQSTFTALGKARHAIFFSLLRKVVIVIPLTLLLPRFTENPVNGVFAAEPISNLIGGVACFTTMLFTLRSECAGMEREMKTSRETETTDRQNGIKRRKIKSR